jgi:hypothetical protein
MEFLVIEFFVVYVPLPVPVYRSLKLCLQKVLKLSYGLATNQLLQIEFSAVLDRYALLTRILRGLVHLRFDFYIRRIIEIRININENR